MQRRHAQLMGALGVTGALLVGSSPAGAQDFHFHASRYDRTDLVSDLPGAVIQDGNLQNAWGMAQGPTTPVWVAANGTNIAALYTDVGGLPAKRGLEVTVPTDGITGQVFNGTSGFVVKDKDGNSGAALFLFDSESGDISGWSPNVPPQTPPPPANFSTEAFNAAHVDGAIFKGLAIASVGDNTYLYASDFHNGKIRVFDDTFTEQDWKGAFRDRRIPDGYAPFNIQAFGDKLYVTYAKQDAQAEDEVAGPAKGFVDVFDTSGNLMKRLVRRGALNAPWGLAIAPDGFGSFSGDLLVGNFGDGHINAYDPESGHFRGTLRGTDGNPIEIDGLWALLFGNGTTAATNTLLFSAGPNDEANGLFGSLTVAPDDGHHGDD